MEIAFWLLFILTPTPNGDQPTLIGKLRSVEECRAYGANEIELRNALPGNAQRTFKCVPAYEAK